MEVNITPEQINQYFANAVLNSALGAHIKEVIEKKLKDLSWRNLIEGVVEQEIRDATQRFITTEYAEILHNAVKEKVTADFTIALVDKVLDGVLKRY